MLRILTYDGTDTARLTHHINVTHGVLAHFIGRDSRFRRNVCLGRATVVEIYFEIFWISVLSRFSRRETFAEA